MNSENRQHTETPRDPVFIGAEAAMHRAAKRARRLAAETARNATGREQMAERPGELETADLVPDPGSLSFSQAQGYEEMPGVLKLEELPENARTRIWNVFYSSIEQHREPVVDLGSCLGYTIGGTWEVVLRDKHIYHDNRSLDEWKNQIQTPTQQMSYTLRGEEPLDELNSGFKHITGELKRSLETLPFHKVFDMIQYILRHPQCPSEVITSIKQEFADSRLAYTIDTETQPTIMPAVTEEEGNAIVCSLHTLRQGGLDASVTHLRAASECINQSDWAGSVRESIHAVESVARQLDPDGAGTLEPALASIERHGRLHPALKVAFSNLYGYTSDEQGIRHALLDRDAADVGIDEAVFMLGACASFASYLFRKNETGNQSGERNGNPIG